MKRDKSISGRAELRAARRESRVLYWAVGLLSFFVNLLMLAGPLYMLNVYDRVLGSRSFETLVALSVLVAFLYIMMGILDHVRGRIMGRVSARFQTRLDQRVFSATIRAATLGRVPAQATTGLRDLEAVQRLMSSPVLMAMFDVPWVPIFLFGIFIFHPLLGLLALGGGAILLIIALLNSRATKRPQEEAAEAAHKADTIGRDIRKEAEMVRALGMKDAAMNRWQEARDRSLRAAIAASDTGGGFTSTTRSFRLFLQSAMLGLGAYLVLLNQLTPGAMIAGSILLGRALAPIETLVGQWVVVQRAREGWENLARLLGEVPVEETRTQLPKPRGRVEAEQVTVVPPGEYQATLRLMTFKVEPGQAVGVIGASGAGKSTLARALTGVWKPAGGKMRLDGAALDQYEPETLGRYIGYLPQRLALFDGTIAENIARMAVSPDDAAVVTAARQAGAHEMILQLPEGYDTMISPTARKLSGGQVQRIGLARALYGDPVMVVLDEPNSNLDNEGTIALNTAIRTLKKEGKCVFIMAHRPAALQECDLLLVLDKGARKAFGPTDEVMRETLVNHADIRQHAQGGVS